MPEISVIVPVYNSSKYIKRCLSSIIEQTFKNFELIVINDGSTDNSGNIINKFKSKCNNIHVIHQKNQGVSKSRNLGISQSTSKYICFVDSDDAVESTMLEDLYSMAIKNDSDIIYSPYLKKLHDGSYVITSRGVLKSNNSQEALNPNLSSSICGQLYKKSLFIDNSIEFPDDLVYEDQLIAIQLLYFAKKTSTLQRAYYKYYSTPASITNEVSIKKIDDIFKIISIIREFYAKYFNPGEYEIHLLAKTLKLLSGYILKYLVVSKNIEQIEYLLEKIYDYKFFNKEIFSEVSLKYFGIYFSFASELITLEHYIVNFQSYKLFPKKTVNTCKRLLEVDANISFEYLITKALLKSNIYKIIIYGGGKIYSELKPLLKKNKIEVIGLIDKNLVCPNSLTLQNYFQEANNLPIVITSIAFANEIEQTIKNHPNYSNNCVIISAKNILNNIS
ncbi:hypothetical protein M947_08520 [Sulfurimonas hongkongensis]|uniref:Glycosyltransferase 2-like domain-containing protein n=1 Tax=Sulfurimonas hongkongensis TaxID=1172190 RepID=T0KQG3_9BACT|nr:glycosyltransferase [Sulfurimonas hongkongensis]EQB39189.1 hypothetical protein M947_08520 [Sulfurimonas hongkongensis]